MDLNDLELFAADLNDVCFSAVDLNDAGFFSVDRFSLTVHAFPVPPKIRNQPMPKPWILISCVTGQIKKACSGRPFSDSM